MTSKSPRKPHILKQSLGYYVSAVGLLIGLAWNLDHAAAANTPFDALSAKSTTSPLAPDSALFGTYEPTFWDVRSGMHQNRVTAMYIDHQGYLWLGSYFGISRFNGQEFVSYNPYNTPALKGDTVTGIVGDDETHFWIATTRGLYRTDGRTFSRFEPPIYNDDITSIAKLPSGDLLVGTKRGLAMIREGQLKLLPAKLELSDIQRIDFFEGQGVFLSGSSKIRRFDLDTGKDGSIPWQLQINGLRTGSSAPLVVDNAGRVWYNDLIGVHRRETDGTTVLLHRTDARLHADYRLIRDNNGDVWVCDERGTATLYRENDVESIDLNARYQVTMVELVFYHEGNYWLGSEEGLIRLKKRSVANLSKLDGLPHHFVYCVTQLSDGSVALGTKNGMAIYDQARDLLTVIELEAGTNDPLDTHVKSIREASEGGIWISNEHYGPLRVLPDPDSESAKLFPSPASSIWDSDNMVVSCMDYDSSGHFWIGTANGAIEVDAEGGFVRHLDVHDMGESPFDVRCFYEHSIGEIWLGSEGRGLAKLVNGSVELFTRARGLSGNEVFAITRQPNSETVWLATDEGLTRIKGDEIRAVRQEDGVPPGTLNQILFEDEDIMWVTSLAGLHRIDTREIASYLSGEKEGPLEFMTVNHEDGMFNAETNGEKQPAGIRDTRGRFWIPTIKGVAYFDPTALFESVTDPAPPLIERIWIDNKIYYDNGKPDNSGFSLADAIELQAGEGQKLEIELAAPSIGLEGKAQYNVSFFPGDNDDNWEPLKESRAIYTTLEPGTHYFKAKAASSKLAWSDPTTAVVITKLPHYYQTPWFYAVLILLFIGIATAIHIRRMRDASLIQQFEQETALKAERERIARDMHDDLGSRLTEISMLGDIAKREDHQLSPAQIDELNQAARKAAVAVEEIVWSVSPNHDSSVDTSEYLVMYAERQLANANISCRNELADTDDPTPLSPEVRHTIFLTFKEAINNIIKHANATEVRLKIVAEHDSMRIRITDDGRGFDTTATMRGNGLRNMARRMSEIGGRFDVKSTSEKGTIVEIFYRFLSDTEFIRLRK